MKSLTSLLAPVSYFGRNGGISRHHGSQVLVTLHKSQEKSVINLQTILPSSLGGNPALTLTLSSLLSLKLQLISSSNKLKRIAVKHGIEHSLADLSMTSFQGNCLRGSFSSIKTCRFHCTYKKLFTCRYRDFLFLLKIGDFLCELQVAHLFKRRLCLFNLLYIE